MSRVFFLEEQSTTKLDLSSVERYGRIVFLHNRFEIKFDNGVSFTQRLLRCLTDYNFDPREDFIAASGKIGEMVGFGVVAGSAFGRIRVLVFDASSRRYEEYQIGEPFDEESAD